MRLLPETIIGESDKNKHHKSQKQQLESSAKPPKSQVISIDNHVCPFFKRHLIKQLIPHGFIMFGILVTFDILNYQKPCNRMNAHKQCVQVIA